MNEAVRARLREGGADRLADLLLEDLLDRPVRELVDPAWLARQLHASARSAADDPRVEAWFRDRVQDVRRRVPAGPPKVPRTITGPLREVLQRPYVPDRALVGALLDHETARLLLKNLFQDLLIAFARRLKPPVPVAPLPALGRLGRLKDNVLGAVGQELEQHLEQRAREFTDNAVQRLVEKMADHLCNPELVREYGAWRAHGLDVLLRTDLRVFAGEVDKLDPDALVATGAALVRGFVGREELAGELEAVLEAAMDEAGGRSARSLLGGTDVGGRGPEGAADAPEAPLLPEVVGDHGIALVRDLLRQRARALVETDAFARWWDEMNA